MFPFSIVKKLFQKIKGSLKDSFSYLGIISVVLFGILVIFFPHLDNNSTTSNLINPILIQPAQSGGGPFVDPTQKQKPESPNFVLVENSSFQAISPPAMVTPQVLGALVGDSDAEDIQKIILEYIVESGDTLGSIAEKFNISLNTVLWANNLNQNSIIQPGQKLVIPPVTGVIHYVKEGDTISEIAAKYKGKVEEIMAFNELSSERDIYVGDVIVVPNGVMPKPEIKYASTWVTLYEGYFICPILAPCRITQGLHWYNAVDFSHGNCGEPILAAAAGEVLKVKLTSSTSRWAFGGAGNTISIKHTNGVVTSYGHIATSFVNPGDEVSQGQIIALMGGQPGTPGAGLSTGCHVHFGVSGARNPFAK